VSKMGLVLVCLLGSTTLWAQSPAPSTAAPDTTPRQSSDSTVTLSANLDGTQSLPTPLRRAEPSDPTGSDASKQPTLYPKVFSRTKPIPTGRSGLRMSGPWSGRDTNFCQSCGKAMTFRQAALDKKATALWASALALTVADVEVLVSRQCLRAGTCREGNPLLGQTRSQQYALRLPVLAAAWMTASWLRKGDEHRHVKGMKYWWIFPEIYQAASGAGVISNLIHAH
jgi:hypothetical protein